MPIYLGSPLTYKAYCSYTPTFDNKLKGQFPYIKFIDKVYIHVHNQKWYRLNTEQHKKETKVQNTTTTTVSGTSSIYSDQWIHSIKIPRQVLVNNCRG